MRRACSASYPFRSIDAKASNAEADFEVVVVLMVLFRYRDSDDTVGLEGVRVASWKVGRDNRKMVRAWANIQFRGST